MSQLTEDMNAAITTLKAQHDGLTAEQVNAVVAQAIEPLQATITRITESEKSDEAKLADVTAAATEFTRAFAPAPSPAPEAAPEAAPAA